MTKVGYVYQFDANSPAVQSGRPHSLLAELRSRASIQEIFRWNTSRSFDGEWLKF